MRRRTLLAYALGCAAAPLIPSLAFAQPALAGLSAEDQALVSEFLRAVNGTPADRAAFLDARVARAPRLPRAEFPQVLDAIAGASGGLNLASAMRRDEMVRLMVTAGANGRTGRIDLHVSPTEPGKLAGLFGIPVPTSWTGAFPQAPLSRHQLKAALEARVRYAAERDDFSGAVLVSNRDGMVYATTVGQANKASRQPNTLATRFNLGSMDKQFTAVAVGQLIDAGRLSLDTSLIEALPGYPNPDAARKITVAHLLTHSAGLGMLFERPGWKPKGRYQRMSELLPIFAAAPLEFEPGTRSSYSNEGFVVLGAVVEKLTGRSWYDQLQTAVYDRAGMADSAHLTDDPAIPRRATGYKFTDADPLGFAARQANWDSLAHRGNSCGGGYSTVADMTRFLQALKAGRMISPERTAQFTTASAHGLPQYGYGFMAVPLPNGRTLVGHDGGGPRSGINSDAKMVWETGWTYAVLGNYDAPFAQTLGHDIGRIISAQA